MTLDLVPHQIPRPPKAKRNRCQRDAVLVYLEHNDVNERYQLYVKDMTADGKKALNKAHVLTYNSFRKAWHKQWELGWVESTKSTPN